MTFGDKLSKLRKTNNYTQEQLADVLGVSRQAISKWESNLAYPETEKLIRISELFDCSLDYLMKDSIESDTTTQINSESGIFKKGIRERKSEKMLWGMPLWHIGRNARGVVALGLNADGIIAVGLKARGIVSLGLLSVGLISFGLLSVGLISAGMLAIGILSAGSFSIGVLTTGAICAGIISIGAVSVGKFSVGALAIGEYFAIGDRAQAMIAIGDTKAMGSIFQKVGTLSAVEIANVKGLLDTIVPTYFSWAKEFIKLFLS